MSQSLSGIGLRSLFENFISTFGRYIAGAFLQLCTAAIIARFYGPDGNGSYSVALLLPTLLATFLNLGIGPANVYYIGSKQYSARSVFSTCLRLAFFFSVAGVCLGGLIIHYRADQFFPGINHTVLWLSLGCFPVILLQGFISSIFQGIQRFHEFNAVILAQPAITLLILSVFISFNIHLLSFLMIAYFMSIAMTLMASLVLLRRHLKPGSGDCLDPYAGKAINYGYKAHLSNILAFINYRADVFLVNFLINPAAAGVYVISVQLSEKLWIISQSVSTVLLPRLSELAAQEDVRLQITPLISRLVFFLTLTVSIIAVIFVYPAIIIIFGARYVDAYVPFIILLPGIVAGSSARVLANDLAARGRPELNMYTSFLVVSLNITGNMILIPHYGLNGAAAATTISYILNFLVRIGMYRYITKSAFFTLFIIRTTDIRGVMRLFKK